MPLGDCVLHVCDQMEISETSSGVKLVPTSAVAYDRDLFFKLVKPLSDSWALDERLHFVSFLSSDLGFLL